MLDHLLLHVVPLSLPSTVDATDVGMGLAVIYEFKLDRWRVFGGAATEEARVQDCNQLIQRLIQADQISGFNLIAYDLPILTRKKRLEFRNHPMYRILSGRANDLAQKVCMALNKDPDSYTRVTETWSLDTIARGTIMVPRVGTGTEGTRELAAGNWAAAVSYALDDAALIKRLLLFVEQHGYVVHNTSNQRLNLRRVEARLVATDLDPLRKAALPTEGPG